MKDETYSRPGYSGRYGVANPFFPHEFETRIVTIGNPFRIFISLEAYNEMLQYTSLCKKEIGWMGTCIRAGNDFIIENTFLLNQIVSGASTEITEDGLSDLAQELLQDYEEGAELWNNIRFWGHSHVYMDTFSSVQDEAQMRHFEESGHPFFVRGIFNKYGKACFTIFLYESGFKVEDVPWSISAEVDPEMRKEILQEIKRKVKFRKHSKVVASYSYRSNESGTPQSCAFVRGAEPEFVVGTLAEDARGDAP